MLQLLLYPINWPQQFVGNVTGVGGWTTYAFTGQSAPKRLINSAVWASWLAVINAFWAVWLAWNFNVWFSACKVEILSLVKKSNIALVLALLLSTISLVAF